MRKFYYILKFCNFRETAVETTEVETKETKEVKEVEEVS